MDGVNKPDDVVRPQTPFVFAHPFLRLALTAWLAYTLAFIALRAIPGDAIENRLRQSGASPDLIERQRQTFGLDHGLPFQYANALRDLLRGDFGISLVTREKVSAMITARLGATLALASAALGVSILLAGVTGTLAALPSTPAPPFLARPLSLLGSGLIALALAAPVYWTGTFVIYLAAHPLRRFDLPAGGTQGIASLLLPALVLGFAVSGGIGRMVENSLRQTFGQPFMTAARAKGLRTPRLFDHALRHSLPPVLSIIALQAGFLLGGTVIVEIMFTRRGLGSLLHQAVLDQDYPVVQALVLLGALVYALTRTLGSWLVRRADPRLRDEAA